MSPVVGDMGVWVTDRKILRTSSSPITIPVTVAAATIGALIALVESMPVLASPSAINRRVSKVAVSVDIRPPTSRRVMPACFKPIVKAALFKPFVCGRILPGIVRPLMLCASSQRQRNRQSSNCKCFTHNLPSKYKSAAGGIVRRFHDQTPPRSECCSPSQKYSELAHRVIVAGELIERNSLI